MSTKLLRLSGASILGLAITGCNIAEPGPFDPRQLQTSERQAATEAIPQPLPVPPTTLESPFLPPAPGQAPSTRPAEGPVATTGPALGVEPVLHLPLQEVVQRAVANNLDVRVAGFQPAIDQSRVVEEEAKFDPRFFTNASYENRDTLQGAAVNSFFPPTQTILESEADIDSLASGLRQNLASGGQAELRYQTSYNNFDPAQVAINPFFENQLVLEVTQPLLRGFGNEINRARITVARNNQRISLLDFRKQLEDTLTEIERTYWQLVAAQQNVTIQEALLRRHAATASLLSKRLAQDVQRVQLAQANAAYESQLAVVVRAKALVRNLSDQLKQLMNDPDLPVASETLILPATDPVEAPIRFDLDDLVKTAMENRFDLGQQQLRVDSASTIVTVARNNLLPKVDLVTSFGAQGLGDEDWGDAFKTQSDFNHLNWRIGLQLEVPIGNREARAIYQRTLLQRQQAIDGYDSLIKKAALEITQSLREVDTSLREIAATRQARFAQADALRALDLREAAGEALTPTFVQLKLDTQTRLAEAQRAEVTAVSAYNVAIALLERAKGTLLRYDNVLMKEQDRPFAMPAGRR